MCQGIYANVRGREGASQALKLGYQAALTVTTLPHCCRCKPSSHLVSLCSQRGVHDKRLPLKLLQPRFCPHSWFLPSGARLLFIQEVFVTGWLHERDFFLFCLADVALMHIWQFFLCFNIMIWKLFTLDVYSCCWVYSSAAFKPLHSPEFLPEFIEGKYRL